MGKTTNILDLNNRLTKVEKENVAQNNYNSLKNRPKINGNLLTGDKTGTQLGLAEAQDITDINTAIGNMSDLGTTATDLVGGINEVNDKIGIKLKTFDVSVPSGASSYNFENEKPSDFGGIVGAFAVGSGANISVGRVRNSEIIFNSAISANSSLRILYSAT